MCPVWLGTALAADFRNPKASRRLCVPRLPLLSGSHLCASGMRSTKASGQTGTTGRMRWFHAPLPLSAVLLAWPGPRRSRNPAAQSSHQQAFKAEQSVVFTMAARVRHCGPPTAPCDLSAIFFDSKMSSIVRDTIVLKTIFFSFFFFFLVGGRKKKEMAHGVYPLIVRHILIPE